MFDSQRQKVVYFIICILVSIVIYANIIHVSYLQWSYILENMERQRVVLYMSRTVPPFGLFRDPTTINCTFTLNLSTTTYESFTSVQQRSDYHERDFPYHSHWCIEVMLLLYFFVFMSGSHHHDHGVPTHFICLLSQTFRVLH